MTALAFAASAVFPPEPLATTMAVARAARVADAAAIHSLIALWAERGLTLRRGIGDVLGAIGDFTVAEMGRVPGAGPIIACGALDVVSPRVAEVRSISVDPTAPRIGGGRAVVSRILMEAAARGIETAVLLTKTPEFFVRCGFVAAEPGEMPAEFIEGHIPRQGRTIVGRVAMRCSIADLAGAWGERG